MMFYLKLLYQKLYAYVLGFSRLLIHHNESFLFKNWTFTLQTTANVLKTSKKQQKKKKVIKT